MPEDQRPLRDRIPVCPHGTLDDIDDGLIVILNELEKNLKRKLIYNSGYRCPACNKAAGGVKNSSHMRGKAVDIKSKTSPERYEITKAALAFGFKRIGIGKTIIHLDLDETLPQRVTWLY